MGQQAGKLSTTFPRLQVPTVFQETATALLRPIEAYSLAQKLQRADLNRDLVIAENEFAALLGLPPSTPLEAIKMLFELARVLGQFPHVGLVGSGGVLAATLANFVVFYSSRHQKVLSANYDIDTLLFILFSLFNRVGKAEVGETPDGEETGEEAGEETIAHDEHNHLLWSSFESVTTFDHIDLALLAAPAGYLLRLLTLCLVLLPLAPHERVDANPKYTSRFAAWSEYETHAWRLLRSMNPDVTTTNLTALLVLHLQFSSGMRVMPHVWNPLRALVQHLLYVDEKHETPAADAAPPPDLSKVLTAPFMAQLATFLPSDLVYTMMRRLYVALDLGFLMRLMESKVFKWNAPTILLVAGLQIPANPTNKRYLAFDEQFPHMLPGTAVLPRTSDKVVYGVLLRQPWKVSNKTPFGDSHTLIFQVLPQQDLYTASTVSKDYVYFSTTGGGLGFGLPVPSTKGRAVRYSPGQVLLTLEPNLEYAVFRHAGPGGLFHPSDTHGDAVWEHRLSISDLEVWGCGGKKELEEQAKRWEWEEREAQARQRVNIRNLGEDRAFMEMAGLVGQHNASGGSI